MRLICFHDDSQVEGKIMHQAYTPLLNLSYFKTVSISFPRNRNIEFWEFIQCYLVVRNSFYWWFFVSTKKLFNSIFYIKACALFIHCHLSCLYLKRDFPCSNVIIAIYSSSSKSSNFSCAAAAANEVYCPLQVTMQVDALRTQTRCSMLIIIIIQRLLLLSRMVESRYCFLYNDSCCCWCWSVSSAAQQLKNQSTFYIAVAPIDVRFLV